MYELKIFIDQMLRSVQIAHPPQRIVSLVPSQTELLHYLGLEAEVVGITRFCEHPKEWFRQKTRIGGTKQVHFDKIADLRPDLIIGNKEENDRQQIERLATDYPVWMSDIKTLPDALTMIQQLGIVVNRSEKANQLVEAIQTTFQQLASKNRSLPPKSVAYLIWKKPNMVAASDTFIDDMLTRAGFRNVFADQRRYPEVSTEQLVAAAPDYLFLSSEPYPFQDKHLAEFQKLCPESVIKLVDGALFSWYGNRLLLAAPYFINLR